MIYLLFDNPSDKGKVSFISQMIHCEVKEIYSPKSQRLIVGWLKGCREVLSTSRHDDTIVCWFDFQAVLCYWLCKLTLKRRKIVCINLLLKDKNSFKNKVVALLYKIALNSKCFVASVTSKEYGEHLKKRLSIKRNFFLLHDVYHDSYSYDKHVEIVPNTVFCGGRNGREWHFMVEVAKAMPDVEFHLVMPKATYQELKGNLPINAISKVNLSYNDFMKEMCASQIVALPLDTEAPAGLIVLFQAAANMKPIVTTDTMTTREYLSDGRGDLLPNNVDDWVSVLKHKLGHKEVCEASVSQMLSFLQTECSEENFVDVIEQMIKELK